MTDRLTAFEVGAEDLDRPRAQPTAAARRNPDWHNLHDDTCDPGTCEVRFALDGGWETELPIGDMIVSGTLTHPLASGQRLNPRTHPHARTKS